MKRFGNVNIWLWFIWDKPFIVLELMHISFVCYENWCKSINQVCPKLHKCILGELPRIKKKEIEGIVFLPTLPKANFKLFVQNKQSAVQGRNIREEILKDHFTKHFSFYLCNSLFMCQIRVLVNFIYKQSRKD